MPVAWPQLKRAMNNGIVRQGRKELIKYSKLDEAQKINITASTGCRTMDGVPEYYGSRVRPPFNLIWHEFTIYHEKSPTLDGFALSQVADGEVLIVVGVNRKARRKHYKHEPLELAGAIRFNVSEFDEPYDKKTTSIRTQMWLNIPDAEEKDGVDALMEMADYVIWSWFMLECKNVILCESHPSNRKRKHYDDPMRIIYKELEIRMTNGKRYEASNMPTQTECCVPLHVRRGHFADYTQGKGLFGKYKVKVWIPGQMVGHKRHGTVTKSYVIGK